MAGNAARFSPEVLQHSGQPQQIVPVERGRDVQVFWYCFHAVERRGNRTDEHVTHIVSRQRSDKFGNIRGTFGMHKTPPLQTSR